MDVARHELTRICGMNNPLSWALETSGSVDEHKYYFLDQGGANETGETALHRLLALHAPPAAVLHFLYHMETHHRVLVALDNSLEASPYADLTVPPPSLLSANRLGCTALHVAVHRNSWQVVPVVQMLLSRCPQLASVPMASSGSYPLHVCTGHSVTIHPTVIETLIQADPTVCHKEDFRGDTPLSLLWKNVLRFRWAQQWEVEGVVPRDILDNHDQLGGPSWMTVIAPDQFRDYALKMLLMQPSNQQKQQQLQQATSSCSSLSFSSSSCCYWKGPMDNTNETPQSPLLTLTWHTIASTPRCPPLLVRLLLEPSQRHHVRGSLLDRDDRGRLPLHCAAAAPPVSMDCLVSDRVRHHALTVLEILVNVAPSAASAMDNSGSLPLHYALRRGGKGSSSSLLPRESDLVALLHACPDALLVPDPLTHLFPALQLASRLGSSKGDDDDTGFLSLLYCMIRSDPEILLPSNMMDF